MGPQLPLGRRRAIGPVLLVWLLALCAAATGPQERIGLLSQASPTTPPAEHERFRLELQRALFGAGGLPVIVDDPASALAAAEPESVQVDQVAERTGARLVVLADLTFGATQGRLGLRLGEQGQGLRRKLQLDFPLDSLRWEELLPAAAELLLGVPRQAAPPPGPALQAAAPPLAAWPGYLGLALGTGLGGLGTALRLSANAARDEYATAGDQQTSMQAESRARDHAVASNLLLGGAAVLLTAGGMYLWLR